MTSQASQAEAVPVIVNPPSVLLGRASETALLRRLVQEPVRPEAALLLRGEAGAGKSALLAHARTLADEAAVRVVGARGVPAEAGLPFAGLHQLLAPLLEHARRLPPLRRKDLLTAFGLVEGEPPAPLRIALAALDLLTAASEQRALLALVDDLQWFDDATRQVLAFVARRLSGGSVVLLGATRDGWPDPFPEARVPELRVHGLPADAASELLSTSAPRLDTASRRLVLRWAVGNPLALLELSRAVDSAAAPADDDGWPPLTDRLQRAFGDHLDDLSPATRTWLLAAALHDGADLGEVSAAACAVDPDADVRSLSPAVRAGIVAVRGYGVVFRHPLVRAAVRQAAAHHERVAMHRALAAQPSVFPEQQLWHRVAAAAGPDADLALQLHELALHYCRRGVLDGAMRASARAAALTVDEQERAGRLLDSADAALRLGRVRQVHQLLRQADQLRLTPGDARRQRLLRWAVHPPEAGDATGVRYLVEKARASAADGDRGTALDVLLLAARSGGTAGREDCGEEVLAALREVGDRPDDARCTLVRAFADPLRSSPAVIEAAHAARGRDLEADEAAKFALAATWVHATDVAVPLLDSAASGLRRSGDVLQLAQVLAVRGWAGYFLGRWDRSLADAGEGALLARETGQPAHVAALDVLHALLCRLRGGDEDVAGPMTAAEQTGLRFGSAAVMNVVQLTRGLSAAADGEYDTAFEHLLRIYVAGDPAHHRTHGCAWLTYLAEVAVHAGRVDTAREVLAEMQPLLELTSAGQLLRSGEYARAVLADDTEAEALYELALGADLSAWPLDRARLHLAYGTWLRRHRRAAESRQPLRRAREAFDALGAPAWGAQARRELRAAGERSAELGPLQVHQVQGLTAQELQIARLASQGLNNREIGQRMRASHRTVGSHLYRVFPKLGITSRQQLAEALKDVGPVEALPSSG